MVKPVSRVILFRGDDVFETTIRALRESGLPKIDFKSFGKAESYCKCSS